MSNESRCCVCGRTLDPKTSISVTIDDSDWQMETFKFCCISCLRKWAEGPPQPASRKEKHQEDDPYIRIEGMERDQFFDLIRSTVSRK